MRWTNILTYYLKGIFKVPVSDEVFKGILEQALELIEPSSSIPGNLIGSFEQDSGAMDYGLDQIAFSPPLRDLLSKRL